MHQHTVQTPYMVGEVHFYSTELECGLVLFDTGPPTPEGEAALLQHVDLARLKYLFITHCHVDHYGLANFITHRSDAQVFIPRSDAIKFQRHGERMERMAELLGSFGFGSELTVPLKLAFFCCWELSRMVLAATFVPLTVPNTCKASPVWISPTAIVAPNFLKIFALVASTV